MRQRRSFGDSRLAGVAWIVGIALTVGACSETRTSKPGDAANGDAAERKAARADAEGSAASEDASPAIDALAEQARQFADRPAAQTSDAGAAEGDQTPFTHGPGGANEVRWLNAPPPEAGIGASVRVTRRDKEPSPTREAVNSDEASTDPDEAADRADAAEASVPAPPAPPKRLTRAQLLDRLAGRLDPGRGEPASLRPWLAKAALSIVDPTRELSGAELEQLDPRHRPIVAAYQRAFARLGRTLGEGESADHALLEDAAVELADQTRGEMPLTIRNVKLCKRVKGFGVYETFERNVFLARRESPVIVYAELDHFDHRTEADGRYAVELTQEIVLYNESDGLPVWRQKPTRIIDRSYNIRRDFFVVQVVRLSPRLTVGKYRLKVTITDEIGRTIDEASVPLRIVADANVGDAAAR